MQKNIWLIFAHKLHFVVQAIVLEMFFIHSYAVSCVNDAYTRGDWFQLPVDQWTFSLSRHCVSCLNVSTFHLFPEWPMKPHFPDILIILGSAKTGLPDKWYTEPFNHVKINKDLKRANGNSRAAACRNWNWYMQYIERVRPVYARSKRMRTYA